MSGPGSITAVILLAERASGNWQEQAGLMLIIAIVIAMCYLTFRLSEQMARLLGTTGTLVLGRMLGVYSRRSPRNSSSTAFRAITG